MKRKIAGASYFRAALAISSALVFSSGAFAQTVEVRGSQRVDAETIRSYFAGSDPAKGIVVMNVRLYNQRDEMMLEFLPVFTMKKRPK